MTETQPLKSRIKVSVTQADIDRAHRDDSYTCVVAQAIARTVPDATRIEVDTQSIRFTSDGERHVYLTPYQVTGYVVAFDAGDEIHPFNFQLREDAKVNVRKRVRTPAGRAHAKASTDTKRAKSRVEQAQAKLDGILAAADATLTDPDAPAPSPAQAELIKAELAVAVEAEQAAQMQAESVKAAYEGQRHIEPDPGKRESPPRVFKMKKRSYGHRLLRVNQQTS